MASTEPSQESTTSASRATAGTIVNIGSRKSVLALIQTSIVQKALEEAWPEFAYEVHAMSTAGDKNQVTALHDFGAKSLWTYELEALLLAGELDLIVHSLKGTAPRAHAGSLVTTTNRWFIPHQIYRHSSHLR